MYIKKKNKNEYVKAGDIWVRNFVKKEASFISINSLVKSEDQATCVRNESKNRTLNFSNIAEEKLTTPKVVIVSDGYDFDEKHKFLSKLPRDVVVFAVNGALKKWKLLPGQEDARAISAYVINNPYHEALRYLPNKDSKYWPSCIASIRTNSEFLSKYKGQKYIYTPTREEGYGYKYSERFYVDDYRNPICASISLAYHFGVKKLMLLCCDDSFEEEREAAIQLENGLWTYPQHLRCQEIIDANLGFLKSQEDNEVEVIDYSSGTNYLNATYINTEQDALKFFIDEDKEKNNG